MFIVARKKSFPNNYDEVFATPSEAFASKPYEEFMDMALMWHIPSSHCCIMRVEHKKTGYLAKYMNEESFILGLKWIIKNNHCFLCSHLFCKQ